jgi:ribosome-binding ATPase YchF (GTP1/OBG family)
MKTGIIGLPQVGKTSLFRILTKAHLSDQSRSNPREAHIGVAKVPDDRLDRLAALYNPKKLVTHTSVEYVDVGAIGQEALKDSAYAAHLRNVDALAHVVRVFDDPSVPHTSARSIPCATSRTSSSISWSAISARSKSGWSAWKKISRR